MSEKSSIHTSTTSQLLTVATFCYIIGCFWIMKAGNTEAGIAGLAGIFMAFKGIYDNRKGHDQAVEKNGKPEEPVKPPEVLP